MERIRTIELNLPAKPVQQLLRRAPKHVKIGRVGKPFKNGDARLYWLVV
jgi:hypothetical protein